MVLLDAKQSDLPSEIAQYLTRAELLIRQTEPSSFVITNQRVTIKSGWLSRRMFEMLLPQIESIHVNQGIIDRFFDTGIVVIHGTGGSQEIFPGIRHALEFRRVATESIERYATR
jgi:uncharacterized membrane protein YdbT with pleckstrin-like domain